MKTILSCLLLLSSILSYSQSNIVVTNSTADAIMAGNYNPANYSGGIIATPNEISMALSNSISPDSLRAYVLKLASFGTRNTASISSSSTTNGLGATNNYVENTFRQISAANGNRLIVSRMNFTATICSSTKTFSEVFAVLPGSSLTDKSFILVEGHLDSRNANSCDPTGVAPGVSDNATGSALVLELARVMSKYNFKSTIVFLLTVGEEQGLFGSKAFANYSSAKNRGIKMVLNNDIAGSSYCGNCSSSPSCTPGNVTVNSMRIFSYGSVNSKQKQLARYVKLEYNEQLKATAAVPMTIHIMSTEDRTGRSSDHVPFRSKGYAAIRMISQNENGDGSACGVVHTIFDTEQVDTNNDGIADTYDVDYEYLGRNALINGNALARAAQAVTKPTSFTATISGNNITVGITDPSNAPYYRIAVRSLTNDWDSVYTVSSKNATISFTPNTSTTRYVSVAATDINGAESIFSDEKTITVPAATASASSNTMSINSDERTTMQILYNYPNPFDESTYLVFKNTGNKKYPNAFMVIRNSMGQVIERRQVEIKDGINEFRFDFGSYQNAGVILCSFESNGRIIAAHKMLLRK